MNQILVQDKIKQNNSKIHKHCKSKLRKRVKIFKVLIDGCNKMVVDQWFGHLDGVTKHGETFNLNFDSKKNKFDTDKNDSTKYAPFWVFDVAFNNNNVTIYQINGYKYKPVKTRIRSVGLQGKVEISGTFKKKQGNDWNLV